MLHDKYQHNPSNNSHNIHHLPITFSHQCRVSYSSIMSLYFHYVAEFHWMQHCCCAAWQISAQSIHVTYITLPSHCPIPQPLCPHLHPVNQTSQTVSSPFPLSNQGPFQYKDCLFHVLGIPILKIRWSHDRLIFNMWIPILVRWHLYIGTAPSLIKHNIIAVLHDKYQHNPSNHPH